MCRTEKLKKKKEKKINKIGVTVYENGGSGFFFLFNFILFFNRAMDVFE
jgi:hypothetical protein